MKALRPTKLSGSTFSLPAAVLMFLVPAVHPAFAQSTFQNFDFEQASVSVPPPVQLSAGAAVTIKLDRFLQNYNSFTFSVPATNRFRIEESSDLVEWHPYFDLFERISSFQIGTYSLGPSLNSAAFYRISDAPADPAEMQQNWNALAIHRYRCRMTRTCFCPPYYILTADITVQDGIVISAENGTSSGSPVPDPDPAQFKSVEQLFAVIATQLTEADIMVIRFDAMTFFPDWLYLDPRYSFVDDETEYRITDFVSLDPP